MSEGSLTRRQFILQASAVGAGLAALGASSFSAEERNRPNIVFILTDDQRYDAMGCMGHPFLQTPHMDRIAREGARFANAFVTTSLCSPSRASILTGKYVHMHGIRGNFAPFPAHETTFPQLLQRAGYETAFVGKWHMGTQEEVQPGFDRWVSFRGHGRYDNPVINVDGEEVHESGNMTDVLTRYAVEWLRKEHRSPFLLYLSHKAPHGPFLPTARHSRLFENQPIRLADNAKDPLDGKPEWQKKWPSIAKNPFFQTPGYEEKVRNYYRTLADVDDSVGRVLAALEEIGQLDNTLVVYASDNGYYLGEHGLADKRSAYEESMRIPLLARFPKRIRPGSIIPQMALNIDLPATFLDLAGVPIPDEMQGRSLLPLLEGGKIPWREDFLYEYFREEAYPETPTMLGVRTAEWKYVEYPESGDLSELYDLRHDPLEMKNLSQDPRYAAKLREMKERLERLKKETRYGEGAVR